MSLPIQLTFDELDTPLHDTTFVVVDLETTGASADTEAITEIGAVKIRGGEVVGEFATLVDPGRSIPPYIVELTGITTAMLIGAPRIERVLPAFLEFAQGAVLVAHNARFDMGFLRAAASRLDVAWPKFSVLCTVKLARRVLTRDEAPSVKLSALASLFQVSTRPTHRALDDARATVDVLHALIERVGNQGVHSYAELVDYLPNVSSGQRAKRHLAAGLPRTPGVYLFKGPGNEVLYVGTSTDLQRRVRNYFTGSETRGRMKEMVDLAVGVDHVECAHGLEAGVRELRLLSAHIPPYNRRSKFPKKGWWITTTSEAFPRLSVVRVPTPGSLGPFTARADAADAAALVAEYAGIRTCTRRLPATKLHGGDCPPTAVGGCAAASSGLLSAEEYASYPEKFLALAAGLDDSVLLAARAKVTRLADSELFESAARLRDRLAILADMLARMHRLAAVAAIAELVAARRTPEGGWELAVVRYGRLTGAAVAPRRVHPMPVVEAITASAETVAPDDTPLRGASPEEVGLIARWLDSDGVRIVRTTDGWMSPVHGAGSWREWCRTAREVSRREHRAYDDVRHR
ncbi:DEDD exonuclease domain-containing protein [Rhodococcus sp. BP-252]|uniref:DEDD exonuclease domain-containing protein n=1 Tax=unclassified Rhodococcus (in: high G+C Gram-positive bacteria) TaxID=192944 RepID=UPI001C9AF130|nr:MULTISPECIES: DEDD exonuclease domain-containing protein [unclassified Rhodococcus (in: high G+C Gram-positive bacteria)]MBY6411390.1 DEDD exonuclease domain-containing protein [Rhodococcus sp. BP-320]MBY6416049.1 DEDD exonuclease domain-containing protein [Rhodococcus sp. BP-321]MBY6420442.1 DEDD exonuclease domain-containing protein [Rhodococcus sp. BP-324]MBY6426256.1 DEDD exonuclease domain-containing protein [Rhodococcus sp. BP-323]MBY6431203.1 DEDD exonuclease domain-containing protei